MKIYTKGGDQGTTSLFGKTRVTKDDARIESYGTVDELNAAMGLLISELERTELPEGLDSLADGLKSIQHHLFDLGSHLASDGSMDEYLPAFPDERTEALEQEIDGMTEPLEPLKQFILPGGHITASNAHACRTICRRAERRVVLLAQTDEQVPAFAIHYLNRLSDYFFTLARFLNYALDVEDVMVNIK